ncbi:SurA N-terminal domain-containing protein [Nesterenkonia suensis]
MSKKLLTSCALAGVLLGIAGCGDAPDDGAETENPAENPADTEQGAEGDAGPEGEAGAEPEMPEPDTSDIPEVVAEVNGVDLSGDDFVALYESQFQQMAMQSQMSGQEVDEEAIREQSLEAMVSNELLIQDAEDSGIDADEDDVDELLETTAEQAGMESVDDLIAAYEDQGMDEEKLREDAHDQVLIDQRLAEIEAEEPTEEELREYYEQAVAQQPAEGPEGEEAEVPEFEDVREDLEEQLESQLQDQAEQEHVAELREDADVETHL